MSNIDKQAYRPDGGDIGTGRIREIADNPYGDEEKCWLAKRVLALLDELEAAENMGKQQRNIAVKLPACRYCPAEHEGSVLWSETETWNQAIYACEEAIIAAGGKPIATCPRCKKELDLSYKRDGAHYCHAIGKGE
ncbi:hypothetical protein LJT59_002075 [Escherichia coli]|nr:hypothetical protein [Escherichia coli]